MSVSVCICEKKDRKGNHRCRALRVEPATRTMTCGKAAELLDAIRGAIGDGAADPCEPRDGVIVKIADLQVDARRLIDHLRAFGWTVRT